MAINFTFYINMCPKLCDCGWEEGGVRGSSAGDWGRGWGLLGWDW